MKVTADVVEALLLLIDKRRTAMLALGRTEVKPSGAAVTTQVTAVKEHATALMTAALAVDGAIALRDAAEAELHA